MASTKTMVVVSGTMILLATVGSTGLARRPSLAKARQTMGAFIAQHRGEVRFDAYAAEHLLRQPVG